MQTLNSDAVMHDFPNPIVFIEWSMWFRVKMLHSESSMGNLPLASVADSSNVCFLTDDLYEILSSLPESVVYSCQPCLHEQPNGEDVNGAGWRELLNQELRTGLERVLECLLNSTLTKHLATCKKVGIRWSLLNLVCCTFKAAAARYCWLFK